MGGLCRAYCLAVLVGFTNGVLVGYFRIPQCRNLWNVFVVSEPPSISDRPQGKVAKELWKIYKGNFHGVPNSLFLVIALILTWLVIRKFSGVKEIYALGGDEKTRI